MNRERILDLVDIIENDRLNDGLIFDMSPYICEILPNSIHAMDHPGCKTAACIAGYTLAAAYGIEKAITMTARPDQTVEQADRSMVNVSYPHAEAARILDLNYKESMSLFIPAAWFKRTKEEAIAVLRNCAATGNIEWSHR